MEYLTNCKNCNAPLYYGEEPFTRCQYCGTEYHFDKIYKKTKMVDVDNNVARQIDDRTIELELYGKKRRYYIGEINFEPIIYDEHFSFDPYISKTRKSYEYKSKLSLIEI